eukprot:TRINITY_DN5104_c0_g3_i1.p1 TRINITY_DN5104_c0_g3~~TRINITY_DN5104_c0_g3_i1.p1  ORF type:complete len:254 (+),score=58.85 TRINITY_DN5104_c0_g3_i1:1617-2378(+)
MLRTLSCSLTLRLDRIQCNPTGAVWCDGFGSGGDVMFVLAELRDAVRLIPELFNKDYGTALTSMLNEKYAGRVVPGIGMGIQVHNITYYSDAVLHPGDGASFSTVNFNLIVFRPFPGELLRGKIKASDVEKGVQVSLGVFDNVWVPPGHLRQKATFDSVEKLWTNELTYEDDDGNGEAERNYLDHGGDVLMTVVSVEFDLTTKPPFENSTAYDPRSGPPPPVTLPMTITGSFAEDGLGPTNWWPEECDYPLSG